MLSESNLCMVYPHNPENPWSLQNQYGWVFPQLPQPKLLNDIWNPQVEGRLIRNHKLYSASYLVQQQGSSGLLEVLKFSYFEFSKPNHALPWTYFVSYPHSLHCTEMQLSSEVPIGGRKEYLLTVSVLRMWSLDLPYPILVWKHRGLSA